MGRGGGNGWLVILGAIALAALAGPVAHAIRDLIMVLAITAVVLAAAGTAAVLTYRARRRGARALTQRGIRRCRPRAAGPGASPTGSGRPDTGKRGRALGGRRGGLTPSSSSTAGA